MFNFLRNLFGPKADFKALLESGALLIDVRSPEEYATGHIPQSANIPLPGIQQEMSRLKSKNVPVIAVCRSGARSGIAVRMLRQAGIEAYNGGGWTKLAEALKI
ncbi:MAG: rhodanese-like domain-containing protein [Lewinellaceae bacterium]|nr:rhodanese-like domain-containing protein [Lewinellaceae bacterium]